MKLFLSITVALAVSISAFAQMGQVTAAISYLDYNELDNAKTAIDKASVNERSVLSAKTWFYRGQIYSRLFQNENPVVAALSENPLEEAYLAYRKCDSLDDKDKFTGDLEQSVNFVMKNMAIMGISEFQNENYDKAITYFGYVLEQNEKDTSTIFNLSLASYKKGDSQSALGYLTKLIELGTGNMDVYRQMEIIHLENKDTVSAINIVSKGREVFPTNTALLRDEINLYILTGKTNLLSTKLEKASELEPTNKLIWFALGTVSEDLKKIDKAEMAYKKAIELDPIYFDANFNLGAMFYNSAAEKVNEANNIPINDTKKYEAAKSNYLAEFNKALPYFEQALKVDPENYNTLRSLREIYDRLGDVDKANEIGAKL
jgi:tetratricopeptide (TPR) repeat protein